MNKTITIGLLLVFCSSVLHGKPTLVLAKLENLPDQYLGEVILKEAYDYLGIKVKVMMLPPRRALHMSKQGKVDGEIQRLPVIEKESPTLIRVPTSISYVDSCVFFTKKIPFRSLEQFGEYTIAYVGGIKSYGPLLKYFKDSQVVTASEQTFKLIKNGRADLTITGRVTGLIQLKQLGIKEIYQLDPPQKTYRLYHYLHEKHLDLVPKIDHVLEKLRKNGELARLRAEAVEDLLQKVAPE